MAERLRHQPAKLDTWVRFPLPPLREGKEKSMVNEIKLRAVMEHVADNLNSWEQDNFVDDGPCGTTACISGHTLLLVGYRLHHEGMVNGSPHYVFLIPDGTREVTPEAAAAVILGLT